MLISCLFDVIKCLCYPKKDTVRPVELSKSGGTVKSHTRQDDRVEQIYQNALALFLERGYDNTPLSLIAKKSGLSKAGLYHYFENKEQLLFSIHQDRIENFLLPIVDRAEKESDPEKRLKLFLREYVITMTHEPTQLLIHEAKRLEPEHYQEILKSWRRVLRLLTHTISELKNRGKVPQALNVTLSAFAAIGMCIWTSYWFDKSRPESTEELVDTITHIFLSGIQSKNCLTDVSETQTDSD